MKIKSQKQFDRPFDVPEAAENLGMRLVRFSLVVLAVLVFVVFAM